MSFTKSARDTTDCEAFNRPNATRLNSFLSNSGFLIAALILAFGFCISTGLITNSTELYSADQNYRLQTESFLSGHLSLSSDPTTLRNDWAWNGQSAQQVWGLGVPILRLPFELLARTFGARTFPDRIVLLLVLGLGLGSALAASIDIARSVSTVNRGILTGLLLATIVLFDPFLFGIAKSRMWVYEEAALVMCCFGLLLWRLVILTAANANHRNFWALAIVAGFSFWIRPTAIFYSLSAIVIISILEAGNARLRSCIFDCWIIFSFLTGSYLIFNWIRFGLPWEFGHSINYTFPRNAYALRFGTKLALTPLNSLISELNQALFACLPSQANVFYDKAPCGSELIPFRFREYYVSSYSNVEGVLFPVGMVCCLGVLTIGRLRQLLRTRAGLSLLWGASSTALMYAFYLRSFSLSSRYLLDFMPGFAALTAGLFGLGSGQIKNSTAKSALYMICILFAGWRIYEVCNLKILADMKGPNLLDSKSALALDLDIRNPSASSKQLPSTMSCPDNLLRFGSAAPRGWKFADSCKVDQATSMIMQSNTCVEMELEFAITDRQRMAAAGNVANNQIKVRRGLVDLEKTRIQSNGTILKLAYCSPRPTDEISSMISIRWKAPQISDIESPAYRLRSVSTIPFPNLN